MAFFFFFPVLASKMSTFASLWSCALSYFKLKLGFLSGQKFSCSSPLEGISQATAAGDTDQSKCTEPCARLCVGKTDGSYFSEIAASLQVCTTRNETHAAFYKLNLASLSMPS